MGIWVRLKFEDSRNAGYEDVMDGQDLLAFLALVTDIFATLIFLYPGYNDHGHDGDDEPVWNLSGFVGVIAPGLQY